ncbi:MAG: metallophosphoesterase family protein [Chitinophagaceae bacterium]
MKSPIRANRILLGILLLIVTGQAKADSTYIKFGAVWKFFDKGVAAPVGKAAADWRQLSFNDASWKSGPAEFGYGANKERTTISFGANADNKYISTYFRRVVNIANLADYTKIRLNAYIDDGAVIYVNGKEVARFNIEGQPDYNTLAAKAEDNGNTIASFDIPASKFAKGKNIIAVEVHQSAANSVGLSFDMELIAKSTAVTEPEILRGPMLQMVSENAITIKWTTSTASSSRIKFGSNENILSTTLTDKKDVTDHEMRITGLQPDKKYFYAVGTTTSILKGSYRNYFTTAPPATTKRKIRIGVFGDPGTGTIKQKSSRDSYIKLKGGYNNAEMVIMLGDNAYNAGTETEHSNKFFNIYDNNVFDNNVIFPVPGNHEYANDHSRAVDHNIPYYSVFTVPTNAESGGLASGTEHYYSYDYGNIHFIMLDSYGYDGGSRLYEDTANGPQAVWLKADLAANAGKHKWTIACLHHPPYTNGSHISDKEQDLVAIRRKITPILERFGVDMVLAGHSHVYERSFLVKDHIGFADSFNDGTIPGGTAVSLSNARYDGSKGNTASADTSASNGSCPYFTIDSVYKHGTVYVVAGSAGQVNSNSANTYPVFYTRNQAGSIGGETGALYLEIEDNRLDAKFVGSSGTIRDQFTIMKGVNRKTIINATAQKPVALSASWIGAYNWQAMQGAPAVTKNQQRSISVKPVSTGQFTYYVSDSISPEKTCVSDTFTLQVTSSMAVTVSNFDALVKNKTAQVQWTSMAAANNDYFTIERSANGQDFETIMVMDANDNNNPAIHYEFADNIPLKGKTYYRLSATDKNNNKVIVGIKSIFNEAEGIKGAATGTN